MHAYYLYMFITLAPHNYLLLVAKVTSKEHNNLSCTNIDSLLPYYNLSTIIKQVTTYTNGFLDYITYMISIIKSFDFIKPIFIHHIILTRPYIISFNPIIMNLFFKIHYNKALPHNIKSSLRLYISPIDLYKIFDRIVYTPKP